jgi:hypothetical protein
MTPRTRPRPAAPAPRPPRLASFLRFLLWPRRLRRPVPPRPPRPARPSPPRRLLAAAAGWLRRESTPEACARPRSCRPRCRLATAAAAASACLAARPATTEAPPRCQPRCQGRGPQRRRWRGSCGAGWGRARRAGCACRCRTTPAGQEPPLCGRRCSRCLARLARGQQRRERQQRAHGQGGCSRCWADAALTSSTPAPRARRRCRQRRCSRRRPRLGSRCCRGALGCGGKPRLGSGGPGCAATGSAADSAVAFPGSA